MNPSSTSVAGIDVRRRTYSVGRALTPLFGSPVASDISATISSASGNARDNVEYTNASTPVAFGSSDAFACRLMNHSAPHEFAADTRAARLDAFDVPSCIVGVGRDTRTSNLPSPRKRSASCMPIS